MTGVNAIPASVSEEDWSSLRALFEAERHAAVEVEGGFLTRNPGQAWTTRFHTRGATTTPQSGEWTWGLELASWGFEGEPIAVGEADSVSAQGGEVSLRWGGALTEWWVNGATGLEHGFTVHGRPVADEIGAGDHGPLRFTMNVGGGLQAVVGERRRSARFVNREGATALTYSGLLAFDANGQDLDAWMEATDGHLTLCVDEHGATYPLTIDPVAQAAYFKASNTDEFDGFGWSVAVSGDTVVVGAQYEDSGGTGVNGGGQADNSARWAGAAYVFRKNGSSWSQEAYLKASNTDLEDLFGGSVAVDGDTIVVGAPAEDSAATGVNSAGQADNAAFSAGAAYVFTRSGTTWTQEAYLKASNTDAEDRFGSSVAIFGDTVVVGAQYESSDGTGVNGGAQTDNSREDAGAAYVFTRSGTTWTQEAYLKASNTDAGDRFGQVVDISADTIVVGARSESSNGTGVNSASQDNNFALRSGAAYVFARSGTTWAQEAYLKASNTGLDDAFGEAVAISGDTIVIGAFLEGSSTTGVNGGGQSDNSMWEAGAAYVFTRSGGTWAQEAYLKASNTNAGDWFGNSVAIDGEAIIVGARYEDSSGTGVDGPGQGDNSAPRSGAAFVFTRDATTWSQEAYLKASNTDARDWFGDTVALSGSTILVGAPFEDGHGTGVNGGSQANNAAPGAGAVYLFELSNPGSLGTNYCVAATNSSGLAAEMTAVGSDSAVNNDVTLAASSLPASSFGYFLTSAATAYVMNPAGSHGHLCLGGSIGRYIAAGQVQNSGASGTFALAIDLTQHPRPTGFVAVQPGQTWHFTAWFRDSVGGQPTSNFSDGLSIDFQ